MSWPLEERQERRCDSWDRSDGKARLRVGWFSGRVELKATSYVREIIRIAGTASQPAH